MLEMAGAAFDPAAVLRGELFRPCSSAARRTISVCNSCSTVSSDTPRRPPAGPCCTRPLRDGERAAQRPEIVLPGGASSDIDRDGASAFLPPEAETFSGFVFKIQANMDPRHRDRIAFLRVWLGAV